MSRCCALGCCALFLSTTLSPAQPDPLAKALQFSDFYNWADSEPWFEQAKASSGGDTRKALYAEIGLIRSTMERRVLPQVSEWLANQLHQNPLLSSDDDLRLFALTVKADIDLEIDARPARLDWEEALALAERKNDAKWIRRARTELGFVSFVEGDVSRSLQAVLGGLAAAKQANDIGAQIRYLGALGTGLTLTKSHQAGLDRINDALAIEAQNQPQAGYSFPAREGKFMALLGLKRNDEAYALAAEIITKARSLQKRVKECQVLLLLAKHFRNEGNSQQAQAYLEQAQELAEAGGFKRFLADVYNMLALRNLEKGDRASAVEFAKKAAESTQASGELYLLPDRLLNVARLELGLGHAEKALSAYETAENAANLVLRWATAIQTRTALVNTLTELYKEHFLFYAQRGDVANAFRVLESSRARTTREVIANEKIGNDKVIALRAKLTESATVDDIRAVSVAVNKENEAKWTDHQRRMVQPVDLRAIRAGLGPKGVLLEYALAEPVAYCMVVTRTSVRVVPLRLGEKAISALLMRYADVLKQKREDKDLAKQLYAALFGPITELADHNEVMISRDGALHLLPFETLIGPTNEYAVMTYEFTYVPSASTWRLLQQIPSKKREVATAFLGIGGLPYDTSSRPQLASSRGYAAKLGNLPGSSEEIRNAAAIAPGRSKLLLGSEGTEKAFKENAPKYRIIHLAVHGRANSVYLDQAALVLLADPTTKEDGLVNSSEIVQLRIGADLVVLSACDTAVGMLVGQDGVANLSRAFLSGGTRAVISTLWTADDTSATSLLKRFYGQLQAQANVAHAMAAAKRDLVKTFRAGPYYWAPYIVEGLGGLRVQ